MQVESALRSSSDPFGSSGGEPAVRKRKPGRPITDPTDNHDLDVRREKARERQRRKRARDKAKMSGDPHSVGEGPTTPVPSIVDPSQQYAEYAQVQQQQQQPGMLNPSSPPRHPEDPLPPVVVDPGMQHQPQPPVVQPEPQLELDEPMPHDEQDLDMLPAAQRSRQHSHAHSHSHSHSLSQSQHHPILVEVPEPPRPMTEDEQKRDKIRKGARERQRKHRALLKAKRMSQMEDLHRLPPVGYAQAHPQHAHHPAGHGPPHAHLLMTADQILYSDHLAAAMQAEASVREGGEGEGHILQPHPTTMPGPLPQGTGLTPGQTFGQNMMLALSCAPMLKTHLLSTLTIAEEELPAIESVMAGAFDQWNHLVSELTSSSSHNPNPFASQRRFAPMHPPPHQGTPTHTSEADQPQPQMYNEPPSSAPGPSTPQAPANAVEFFRERFQRTLAQPSPYATLEGEKQRTPKKRKASGGGGRKGGVPLLKPVMDHAQMIGMGIMHGVGESEEDDDELRDMTQVSRIV